MNAGNQILEHTPEDMTVTVEAGMTLGILQGELARHRQWLPLDPPHPETLSIGELINQNVSGPRRFGYGTIRDYLIGIEVALADGTVIHSGGKVVKNVAGYDLMKLFIGARGSLGIVLKTTFKLRPLPETEKFVQAWCKTLDEADKLIEAVVQSEMTPVVIDLHNLKSLSPSACHPLTPALSPTGGEGEEGRVRNNGDSLSASEEHFTIVLGFAGTREEVEWQLARAEELGFKEPGSLDYEVIFWSESAQEHRLSVLPSKMVEVLRGLNAPFVARAGNGVIYHHGPTTPRTEELPFELMRRVKAAFDPNNTLPKMPL